MEASIIGDCACSGAYLQSRVACWVCGYDREVDLRLLCAELVCADGDSWDGVTEIP